MKMPKKPPPRPPGNKTRKAPVSPAVPAVRPGKTALKERPADLREILSSVMDSVPHAILGVKKRKIVFANQNVKKVFGWDPEELIGKDSRILYRSDDEYREISERHYPALKKERNLMGEIFLRHRDGSDLICFVSAARIGEELKDRTIVVTCEDITERKKNEEALRKYREGLEEKIQERTGRLQKEMLAQKIASEQALVANERLHYLLTGTPAVIYAAKPSGDYAATFISNNVERMTGFKADPYIADPAFWIERVHPDDRPRVEGAVAKAIAQGTNAYEYRFRRRDGTYIWVRDEMRLVRDDRGEPLEIIGYWTDVSDRKKIEEDLNKESFLLREYFENLPLMAYHITFDGWIVDCNAAVLKALGYENKEELIGKSLIEKIYAPASREKARTLLTKWKKDRVLRNEELQIVTKTGEVRDILLNVDTVYDEKALPLYSLSTQIDITDRKRAEEASRASEQKYRLVLENAGEAIFIAQEGMLRYVNPASVKLIGYAQEVLTAKPFTEFIHPEDRFLVLEQHLKRLGGEEIPEVYSFRVVASDGTVKWVEIHATSIEWEGRPATINFLSDITERKRAEDDLRERERNLRSIFLAAPIGIGVVVHRVIQRVNARLCDMLGYASDDLIGNSARMVYASEEDFEAVGRDKYAQIEKRGVGSVETRWVRKDGRIIDVQLSSAPLNPHDLAEGVTFTAVDITEQKRAETVLRQSEEKFYKAFQASPSLMSIRPLKDGAFIDVNDAFARVVGYTREEMIGKTSEELGITKAGVYLKVCDLASRRTAARDMEETFKTRTGEERTGIFSSEIIRIKGEPCLLTVVNDITERKRAEETLRESEERYRLLYENTPVGVCTYDSRLRVTDCNDRYASILRTSREKVIGFDLNKMVDQGPLSAIRLSLEGKNGTYENLYRTTSSGMDVWLSAHTAPLYDGAGNIIGGMGIVEDITERKRLEAQLLQAQKMEAVGTLAGGIAHDFNNLLTGILGHTTVMISDLQPTHPFFERLQGIEQFVKSGAGLTRQLLGFASKGIYDVRPADINALVDRTAAMFGRTRKEITIHRAFQDDLWVSEVDMTQMEQVLMNLFVNAWQAMSQGGSLYLETSNYTIEEEDSRHSFLAPGRYVKISVTDTGTGMDEKTMEKIFDPFFTTKEMGRGTGLGLATVYGIIKSHGGHITVYSQAGGGSTFNIYLPASEKEIVRETVAPGEERRKGRETILLVDDEYEIRDVMKDVLEMLGHEVLEAGNGDEALQLYQTQRDRIDLVILDMVMPGMGGGEVFDRLKNLNPDVKVILSSGYSINGEAKSIMQKGCQGFIQKPVSISELSRKIGEVLEED